MKNFIEVHKTEDEQAEQIKKWIKENGGQIIAGVVMGLSAIWGFDYYKNYQNEQSTQARSHYLSLVVNPNNTESFDKLQNNYTGSGYVDQSSLLMAKNAVKINNTNKHLITSHLCLRVKMNSLLTVPNLEWLQFTLR